MLSPERWAFAVYAAALLLSARLLWIDIAVLLIEIAAHIRSSVVFGKLLQVRREGEVSCAAGHQGAQ
jgi:hypothetical protein